MNAKGPQRRAVGSLQCWSAEVNFRNGFPKASDTENATGFCDAKISAKLQDFHTQES